MIIRPYGLVRCLCSKKNYLCGIILNLTIMKKLHITIFLFLWCFAQVAEAQNVYRNYLSNYVTKPESAVSVVHSNGSVYFFQKMGKLLSITELDPVLLTPTGNDILFDFNQNTAIFNFVFQGAFEGFGNKIVLYGYHNTQYILWNPVVMIFDPTAQTLQYIHMLCNGSFTEGCAGYKNNGNKIYSFIYNDKELFVVEEANLISNPIVFETYTPDAFTNYTDISWDATYNNFILSGTHSASATQWLGPFVDIVEVNNGSLSHLTTYYLDNQTYNDFSMEKTMHAKIDNSHLLVYHGLRNSEVDILWMSLVENYHDNTHFVTDSWFYYLPCSKTEISDFIYDKMNNRFNFLGNLNFCSISPYLAQGDPYSLSSNLKIGMLNGNMATPTCSTSTTPSQVILYTPFRVNRMELNTFSHSPTILVSGIDENLKKSILTETFDISLSSCDNPLVVIPKPAPKQSVNFYPVISNNTAQGISYVFSSSTDIVLENKICN